MSEGTQRVRKAFFEASSRAPLAANNDLIAAVTPPGGDWQCVVNDRAICRSIYWGRIEVALVNPRGDLDDTTEGQIAMAMRALPMLDAAMRSIIVLAETADNAALIRELAVAAVEFIERPAPRVPEPEDDEV